MCVCVIIAAVLFFFWWLVRSQPCHPRCAFSLSLLAHCQQHGDVQAYGSICTCTVYRSFLGRCFSPHKCWCVVTPSPDSSYRTHATALHHSLFTLFILCLSFCLHVHIATLISRAAVTCVSVLFLFVCFSLRRVYIFYFAPHSPPPPRLRSSMVDQAAEDFADAYNCVFTRCGGFQSPLPLTRVARRGETVLTAVATLGACSSPSVDRLLRFDMSRVSACASLWHLCCAEWRPVALEPAAYRQLVVSLPSCADVTAMISTSPSTVPSATFLYPHNDDEVLRRTVPHVDCVAIGEQHVWWVSQGDTEASGLSCSDVDGVFASQKSVPSVTTTIPRGARGVLLDTENRVLLYGTCGLQSVDARAPSSIAALTGPANVYGLRSAALVNQYCIAAQADSGDLVVWDMRKPATTAPLLRKAMATVVNIRGHRDLHGVLLVSHGAVAMLDISATAMVGAMDCTEGHFLDAELMTCHGRSARICATTSTGMLFDYTMTY